jgi:subtilisin family serine protease
VIAGIIYAADQGADVINMSLGAGADLRDAGDRKLVAQIQAAVAYARFKGVVVVAAAGNEGINLATLPPYLIAVPAELAGVIAVGATAPFNFANFDNKASYSDYGWAGKPFGDVPLFAPGGDYVDPTGVEDVFDLIISPCSQYQKQTELPFPCTGQDYVLGAGTSFAAPMVAGEAAVIRSIVGGSTLASLTTNKCTLVSTDVIGPSAIFGRGRMNVVKAAACARGGRPTLAN